MRCVEVDFRAFGHNLSRVNAGMALVVVVLDVQHIHGLLNTLYLIEFARVGKQIGVVH